MRLGPWLRTQDMAVQDAEGYFCSTGRSEDLIKSSGFRIGRAEIEGCLLSRAGAAGAEPHRLDLADHVRTRLAGCKAPREVKRVADFALTSSGRINRRQLRGDERAKGGHGKKQSPTLVRLA